MKALLFHGTKESLDDSAGCPLCTTAGASVETETGAPCARVVETQGNNAKNVESERTPPGYRFPLHRHRHRHRDPHPAALRRAALEEDIHPDTHTMAPGGSNQNVPRVRCIRLHVVTRCPTEASLNRSKGVPAVGAVAPVGMRESSTGVYSAACSLMRCSMTEREQS